MTLSIFSKSFILFGLTTQVLVHVPADLEEGLDGWRVVVFPGIALDVSVELLRAVFSVAEVEYPMMAGVLFVQEFGYVCYVVSVHGFEA